MVERSSRSRFALLTELDNVARARSASAAREARAIGAAHAISTAA